MHNRNSRNAGYVTGFTKKTLHALAFSCALLAPGLGGAADLVLVDGTATRTCNYTDISIDPDTGIATINVTNLDDPDCAGGSSGGNPPPAPSLSVSSSSITQGTSLTVNWNSTNADTCTATGTFPGWPGTKATSGTNFLPTDSSTPLGNLTLELSCSNTSGSSPVTTRTVAVSEDGGGPGPECTGTRAPPPGMSRAIQCDLFNTSVDCRSYAAVFGGIPGTTGIRQLAVNQNQYMAMQFDPATVPAAARGEFNLEALQGANSDITFGQPLWSFSTCPGDFSTASVNEMGDPDCLLGGFAAKFGFKFGGSNSVGIADRCGLQLEDGTVYYLNVLWTNDPPGTPNANLTWECGTGDNECGAQFQVGNFSGW